MKQADLKIIRDCGHEFIVSVFSPRSPMTSTSYAEAVTYAEQKDKESCPACYMSNFDYNAQREQSHNIENRIFGDAEDCGRQYGEWDRSHDNQERGKQLARKFFHSQSGAWEETAQGRFYLAYQEAYNN